MHINVMLLVDLCGSNKSWGPQLVLSINLLSICAVFSYLFLYSVYASLKSGGCEVSCTFLFLYKMSNTSNTCWIDN